MVDHEETKHMPARKIHWRPTQHPDGVFRGLEGKPAAPDNVEHPEEAEHVMKLLDNYVSHIKRGQRELAEKPIKSLDDALRILGLEGEQLTSELIRSRYIGLLKYSHPDRYNHAGQEVHGGYDRAEIIRRYNFITQIINQAKAIALESLG